MQGCPDSSSLGHSPKSMQDCAFKPCLDSQDDSPSYLNRLVKPDLPVFMLTLICAFLCLLPNYPPTKTAYKADPPSGRRILLIYWFCTLLN